MKIDTKYSIGEELKRQRNGNTEILIVEQLCIAKDHVKYGGTIKESGCRWAAEEDELTNSWGLI